jgi:hypothetical protein
MMNAIIDGNRIRSKWDIEMLVGDVYAQIRVMKALKANRLKSAIKLFDDGPIMTLPAVIEHYFYRLAVLSELNAIIKRANKRESYASIESYDNFYDEPEYSGNDYLGYYDDDDL